MNDRARAIEALQLVTIGGLRWSSAWWEEGTVQERYDETVHRDECRPGEHRFVAAGPRSNVARCSICGERTRFERLDAPPRCTAMVKPRGFPMAAMRQCRGHAWSPDGKRCWTHFRV